MRGPPPQLLAEMAAEEGFDLVGFGPADVGADGGRFLRWIDAGRHGEMAYLERNRERIADPRRWAPHARSTVALARDYGRTGFTLPGGGRIARYAVGRDYHRALGNGVERLRRRLAAEGVPAEHMRGGTDAVPVLERALAARAGIGFLAKSATVIAPQRGPYLLLAELLTPLELPPSPPAAGSCGTCTACLDACPTGAIPAPHEVDARRCLSYTTIELRGAVPHELRAAQGDWLFGCDVCLEVCPFTRFSPGLATAEADRHPDLQVHRALHTHTLVEVLALDEAAWAEHWTGTAVRRATRRGLRRNAAVVLGNLRDERAVPALVTALADPEPVVRSHAAWALARIAPRHPSLSAAWTGETDPETRRDIGRTLADSGS